MNPIMFSGKVKTIQGGCAMGEINERMLISPNVILPDTDVSGRWHDKGEEIQQFIGGIIEKVTLKQISGGDWTPYLVIRDDEGEQQWINIGSTLDFWISPQKFCIRCQTPIKPSELDQIIKNHSNFARFVRKPPAQIFCTQCKTDLRTRSIWSEHCNSSGENCASNKQWGASCGKCKRCIACPKNHACLQSYVIGLFFLPNNGDNSKSGADKEDSTANGFIAVMPEDRIALMLNVWDCPGGIILRLKNPLRTLPIVTKWAIDLFQKLNDINQMLGSQIMRVIETEFGGNRSSDEMSESERYGLEMDRISEALCAGWGLGFRWPGADWVPNDHGITLNIPTSSFAMERLEQKNISCVCEPSTPSHKRSWAEFNGQILPFNWDEFYSKLEFDKCENDSNVAPEISPPPCDEFVPNFYTDTDDHESGKFWESVGNWIISQSKILNRVGKATLYTNLQWKKGNRKIKDLPISSFDREDVNSQHLQWIRLSGAIEINHGLKVQLRSPEFPPAQSFLLNLEELIGHQIYRHG
jgi:hypothetical protein